MRSRGKGWQGLQARTHAERIGGRNSRGRRTWRGESERITEAEKTTEEQEEEEDEEAERKQKKKNNRVTRV